MSTAKEPVSKRKPWTCPMCLANVAANINHYCLGNGNRIPTYEEMSQKRGDHWWDRLTRGRKVA